MFTRLLQSRHVLCKYSKHRYFSGLINESNSILRKLVAINHTDRDEKWLETFFDIVGSANLIVSKEVTYGPDGFHYIDMRIPDIDEDLQDVDAGSLDFLKDQIIKNDGYGVVIKSSDDKVNWVFSYGDIVNLYMNNTFKPKDRPAGVKDGKDQFKEGEELRVSNPPEEYLPVPVRTALRQFFGRYKIKTPRCALIKRTLKSGEEVQELAFVGSNIPQEVAERVVWFLPRHYLIVIIAATDCPFPSTPL